MSDEDKHEEDESEPGAPESRGDREAEGLTPDEDVDGAEEPQGAEVLLPKSIWLRAAWVLFAVFWVVAVASLFVQSCTPR